ncbi:MAG: hypothetical protein HQK91_07460 [Nitrospirae bacterium]|nr:hypothetical protein [Nitrospirota bacterium]
MEENKCNYNYERLYLNILKNIDKMEGRLSKTENLFVIIDLVILLFSVTGLFVLSIAAHYKSHSVITLGGLQILLICGMVLTTRWAIIAMKSQLKIKLRYFQARSIERKINCQCFSIITDEQHFYNPDIHKLESFDNAESLDYPQKGPTGMDGYLGSTKPRMITMVPASFFFFTYQILFILVLIRYFL